MINQYLTIKELTENVGGKVTPRMVRHYHTLGLLPPAQRSSGNYRLYTQQDAQRLRRIVALKEQGFQLSHIQQLLKNDSDTEVNSTLMTQLQQQYQAVIEQISRLRQTAAALEGVLGRDQHCQTLQANVLAQLRLLEVETQGGLQELEQLWQNLDTAISSHPEAFEESLQHLLPELGDRSEIEIDLLSQLVLACGDVSIVNFVRISKNAIAAARHGMLAQCQIVGDIPAVTAMLDQTRLAHLGCQITTLIDNPHVTDVVEAEQAFWQQSTWSKNLEKIEPQSILMIGYAPSILMWVCEAISLHQIQPALVVGMPIGFSHAPAAKRQLIRSGIPYITIEKTNYGGFLAAVVINALAKSLIDKPDCHCYLQSL
ncbi:MerR family transcriptional regulator [Aphanothece hegewaldii CCALA 016]|uniref:MerR family transcriptional regulator n=1 Tax=Aphanothece hegewaldii CCALA 016 TaxID=2107694 RepID=A0A2T1M474_9CHRO|nr:precorrin-8X methylmutase [Aphanothece hegewaldii]PSF39570.1 MerR family transcriptional regulator [Aphanothece hegewaldii CCALA 016]